ncbi:mismatch repair endonuclease PMS2 [Ditylenchus destructor]|uniref:Mismatch repair endonuclease PMS2 n=1 Tax=Ditylenchus destructor TaxID=166010 RepID=A0AAD4RBV5_9BILA|nr:mismatch repair endonuclease PMS2 [Ditylenchus destructor]
MKVIGQFNEAFIITRMGKQMFMIDQHAADEKYNFERLQKNSRGTSQKLIQPMILNLGAVEENILMDNIDILKANNFDFAFNDSDRPGNRVRLTAVPMIKDCQFDSNDVDEILNFLKDFPGTFYQPKKLQTYFASKACRSSVMFGKALHKQQMKWIVKHMGEMEKPWNCPHGRPTIRHIGDLRTIL